MRQSSPRQIQTVVALGVTTFLLFLTLIVVSIPFPTVPASLAPSDETLAGSASEPGLIASLPILLVALMAILVLLTAGRLMRTRLRRRRRRGSGSFWAAGVRQLGPDATHAELAFEGGVPEPLGQAGGERRSRRLQRQAGGERRSRRLQRQARGERRSRRLQRAVIVSASMVTLVACVGVVYIVAFSDRDPQAVRIDTASRGDLPLTLVMAAGFLFLTVLATLLVTRVLAKRAKAARHQIDLLDMVQMIEDGIAPETARATVAAAASARSRLRKGGRLSRWLERRHRERLARMLQDPTTDETPTIGLSAANLSGAPRARRRAKPEGLQGWLEGLDRKAAAQLSAEAMIAGGERTSRTITDAQDLREHGFIEVPTELDLSSTPARRERRRIGGDSLLTRTIWIASLFSFTFGVTLTIAFIVTVIKLGEL